MRTAHLSTQGNTWQTPFYPFLPFASCLLFDPILLFARVKPHSCKLDGRPIHTAQCFNDIPKYTCNKLRYTRSLNQHHSIIPIFSTNCQGFNLRRRKNSVRGTAGRVQNGAAPADVALAPPTPRCSLGAARHTPRCGSSVPGQRATGGRLKLEKKCSEMWQELDDYDSYNLM